MVSVGRTSKGVFLKTKADAVVIHESYTVQYNGVLD